MATKLRTITLQQLREEIRSLDDLPGDSLITFGHGDLVFSRIKERGPLTGPRVFNVEFLTPYRATTQPDDDPA